MLPVEVSYDCWNAGATVRGEIDWDRRFDHMQQHTGQHVLSAAFDRLFDNRTMSFHMGAEVSTIDLAKEMSWDQITAAEQEAQKLHAPCAIAVVDTSGTLIAFLKRPTHH